MGSNREEVMTKLWDVIHYIESISSTIGERRATYLELTLRNVERELDCCFLTLEEQGGVMDEES